MGYPSLSKYLNTTKGVSLIFLWGKFGGHGGDGPISEELKGSNLEYGHICVNPRNLWKKKLYIFFEKSGTLTCISED